MQGHCLCGAVTISAPQRTGVSVCHCGMCRRWGGGPLFALECGSGVAIEGGEHVVSYRSSAWAERAFCRRCGTHLYYRMLEGGSYAIPAGLLDDASGFALAMQIFIDEKPAYYSLAEPVPSLTGAQVSAAYGRG